MSAFTRPAPRRFESAALGLLAVAVLGLYASALPGHLAKMGAGAQRPVALDLAAHPDIAAPPPAKPLVMDGRITAAELRRHFLAVGYTLNEVRQGSGDVPRLFVDQVPPDLKGMNDIQLRKSLFFRLTLPLVLRVNEEIAVERGRLLDLAQRLDQGGELAAADRVWLKRLAGKYGLKAEGGKIDMAELKKRVDGIPPSLALAQAAEESGWGTSRFARQGNALFGQWTMDEEAGLVPADRPDGASHAVRAFPSLLHGVEAYMRNLNTHAAYRGFRDRRAVLRETASRLDGYQLAGTLTSYSERGQEYVETLRTIISANELKTLDHAWLGEVTDQLAARL
ncbi:glucosaminidase domain-containing protein [Roseospirillum parvum]|uniref:Bax protein n=1 Tax=Roseospirillum parvum TaxID=83401 RepID=A0A1G7TUM4_9PROT|nr:glucosaminidase domain-containing protein [Roseospirillum parvum]SDG38429.1 Bax protein [Roseospirillum parvum]